MNTVDGRSLLKGLFLAAGLVLLAPSGSASADTWCRRDFDRDNATCVFGSARDCVRAASVAGGICEREPPGRGPAAKSSRVK